MRVWLSSEADYEVDGALGPIRNNVEKALLAYFQDRSYGDGLVEWAYLAIVIGDKFPMLDFKEVHRYSKRKKECEFRLKIDHAAFKNADRAGRFRLLAESLLRSLTLLEAMQPLNVDVAALKADFLELAGRKKWLP